jgi:DNA polymerase-3 subunit chi
MTEITFHLNTPEKMEYCCRLIRKACSSSANVVVKANAELLSELDQALWSFSKTDFIGHCKLTDDAPLVKSSQVVLAQSIDTLGALPHHDVLLNLDEEVALGYEKFERVIEVVGMEESDKAKARQKWRYYSQRGYPLKKHEVT